MPVNGFGGPVTLDTNIAVYALSTDIKAQLAAEVLQSCSFLSVQVLNEYVNVATRKLRRDRVTITGDLDRLRAAKPDILAINENATVEALRIAERYQLSFYDAPMLAVVLLGGARTFYSEDMQHNMIINGSLRIIDPFC